MNVSVMTVHLVIASKPGVGVENDGPVTARIIEAIKLAANEDELIEVAVHDAAALAHIVVGGKALRDIGVRATPQRLREGDGPNTPHFTRDPQ